MKWVLLTLGLLLAASTTGLLMWFSASGPVLVEWREPGALCDPPFVLLNPFRDRSIERVADNFLERLKRDDLSLLDRAISDPERRNHVRGREHEYKIKSWYSAGRTQTNGEATIEYWITRHNGSCLGVLMELKRVEDGWEVSNYNPIY